MLLLWFWAACSAQGQTQIFVQEGTLDSRSLSGHVKGGSEETAVKDVVVELCTPDWKSVLASTKTDDAGYFYFKKLAGRLFYLRFFAPGFHQLESKVRINKHATHDLIVHLTVAT
jgi:hypothetical protein